MPNEALRLSNNLRHNVFIPVQADTPIGLMVLAERYFGIQVAGQAEGTIDAKQRKLACFLTFYTRLYGHDDRREWYKSVA